MKVKKWLYDQMKEQFKEFTGIEMNDYELLFFDNMLKNTNVRKIESNILEFKDDMCKEDILVEMYDNVLTSQDSDDFSYQIVDSNNMLIIKCIILGETNGFLINEYILKKR